MKLRLGVCVAAILFSSSVLATDGSVDNVGQLLEACKLGHRIENNQGMKPGQVGAAFTAVGYFRGAIETVRFYSIGRKDAFVCIPDALYAGQAMAIFEKWAEAHPDQWHQLPIIGVMSSLAEKFPCD